MNWFSFAIGAFIGWLMASIVGSRSQQNFRGGRAKQRSPELWSQHQMTPPMERMESGPRPWERPEAQRGMGERMPFSGQGFSGGEQRSETAQPGSRGTGQMPEPPRETHEASPPPAGAATTDAGITADTGMRTVGAEETAAARPFTEPDSRGMSDAFAEGTFDVAATSAEDMFEVVETSGEEIAGEAGTSAQDMVDTTRTSSDDMFETAEIAPEARLDVEETSTAQMFDMPGASISAALGEMPGTAETGPELELIEGIGPKIAVYLRENGISTMEQLAQTSVDELRDLLRAGGTRFQTADPSTWPEQARLAANKNWNELQVFQDSLKAGRKQS